MKKGTAASTAQILSGNMKTLLNILQLFLVSIWTAISAIITITLVIVTGKKSMSAIVARNIWSPAILFFCGARLSVSGRENIDQKGNYIFVSNHESLLDIPAIYCSVPLNIFFIAKKELKKVPFMGWAMMMGGMIFIDRKNKEQARKDMLRAGELIKSGKNIISFPEGTRTKTGELGLFKRGGFLLSKNTGIPVVPIAIKGARELLPSGSIGIKPGIIYVHLFPPVSPEKYTPEEVDIFAADTRLQILQKKSMW